MSRYFDPTDPTHLALLPKGLREDEDLVNIAAVVEDDIIDAFTRLTPDCTLRYSNPSTLPSEWNLAYGLEVGTVTERWVWLKGYNPDAAQAIASFATAMRREVANTIRWRHARDNKKPNVESESAGDPATTKTYRADAEHRFPPDFGRALEPFKIGATVWAI